MPPLTPVGLSKSRVQGADEVAKSFTVHASHTAPLGASKHPGMLSGIPEQGGLLMAFLVILVGKGATEWANELPFSGSIGHECFYGISKVML